MELFRLFGSILIDDEKAIDALKKTDKKAEATSGKFGAMAAKAAGIGAAVVGAGVAAATGLAAIAQSTAATGDRVDKLSQKIGLSREGFQEWDYVMSQNGMSIDVMQGGMKKLTGALDDMKNGGKLATESFARVGLSLDDLKGKSSEEVFELTVAGLQGVSDEAERAALANDLFGKSGCEVAPLLNQSAESIEALKNNAHELEGCDGFVLLF